MVIVGGLVGRTHFRPQDNFSVVGQDLEGYFAAHRLGCTDKSSKAILLLIVLASRGTVRHQLIEAERQWVCGWFESACCC